MQKLLFCPKCSYEQLGKTIRGSIEIENDYVVEIKFNKNVTIADRILLIRKIDKRSSISKLKTILSNKDAFCLHAEHKIKADRIYKQAIALGLKAKIINALD